MATRTLACHRIPTDELESFDAQSYSQFKYGSGEIAKAYGKELLDKFLHSGFIDLEGCTGNDIVVTASPYKYIAPAASSIAQHFTDQLNETLMDIGKPSANQIKISRDVLFEGDYGRLSEESRNSLLSKDKLHMDTSFVEGKILIIIDDIKITGAHEKKIIAMLSELQAKPRDVFYLYYAEMADHDIDPSIEDYLNHYSIKRLGDVLRMMTYPHFVLNARVCKYFLSYPDKMLVELACYQTSLRVINQLYFASVGDGYHTMELYKTNFNILQKAYKDRNGSYPYYLEPDSYRIHSLYRQRSSASSNGEESTRETAETSSDMGYPWRIRA